MDNSWAAPGVMCEVIPGETFVTIETGERNSGPDWAGPYKIVNVCVMEGLIFITLYGDIIDHFWAVNNFRPLTDQKHDVEKFAHLLTPSIDELMTLSASLSEAAGSGRVGA